MPASPPVSTIFPAGVTLQQLAFLADTDSGEVREYFNPQGTAFVPILDTEAFGTCP